MELLTTGKLAKQSKVNKETIRFYERKGLIKEPERNESGYRLYDQGTVNRIKFIKNAQNMGFTLREIDELLSLRVDDSNKCAEAMELAEKKIAQVDEKISHLQRVRKALNKLASACRPDESIGECPILEAFYSENE